MFDAIFGFILLGLGLKKTIPPTVLGDHDETEQSSGSTGTSESNSGGSSGSTGTSSSGSGSSHDDSDDVTGTSSSAGASSSVESENETESERKIAALKASEGLRVMQPKFTPEQQEAFQKERKKRADNLKKVGDERVKKLEESFTKLQEQRKEKDKATRETLAAKVREFKSTDKRTKLLSLSDKYQKAVTNSLSAMQKKLQSMLSLLDKVTAAAGALKTQGTDVSLVEADVSTAQTKVSSAIYQVNTLVDALPTAFSVSTEDAAKADVEKAITESRSKIDGVRTAFKEAHTAVEKAVSDLEALTDAKEVGVWPEKK